MIPELREAYNRKFSDSAYQTFLQWIYRQYDHVPKFRIAETPVFIPNDLKTKLFQACEEITDVICRPDFLELSQSAVLAGQIVPGETPHTAFLQMDFGVCLDENGQFTPQLIEAQGFPSLYFFQDLLARAYQEHFDIPAGYSHLFDGMDQTEYLQILRNTIIGDHAPENVILLEVEPEKQTTAIDFFACRQMLGIDFVCVSDLKVEGREVFYFRNGKKTKVEKIFNRIIFDELIQRDDIRREFYFTEEHDVDWAGHPHWFFRISKHTLPLLNSRYVPKSYFLHELEEMPEDLHNFVLKPLYSFAGTGVIINLNRYDLDSIQDKENYILQRKVEYAPVIQTPSGPAKAEIRMLMLWERGAPRPRIVNNLVRLSKGEMVGVRYNKDKDWVGASVGFFEP